MVMVLAALLIQGFIPGPQMIRLAPKLLYAASGGMMASTVWLIAIGWPISIYTLKLMTLNRQLILIGSVALCLIGVFSLNGSFFSVFLLIFFGLVGYYMRRYGYSVAGAAIAVVLGGEFEANLRRGSMIADNWVDFITRPWTAIVLLICAAFLIYGTIGTIKLARRAAEIKKKAIAAHLATLAESGNGAN
jgi:putative tricarboxylic transport membrane protein